MKKAFIHVVEIVIISLVVFVLVMQFAVIPSVRSDWPRAKLNLLGNDVLFSLDKSLEAQGRSWLDVRAEELGSLLAGTGLVYSLEVKGAIKPDIIVGCLCYPGELASIREALNHTNPAFTINGQQTRFWVEPLNPVDPEFPTWYDVIIITEDISLTRTEDYLAGGGGLVLYRNLGQNDLPGPVTNLFGLAWSPDLVSPGELAFSVGPESPYYPIPKYFSHIPKGGDGYFSQDYRFSNFIPGEFITATGGAVAVLESQGGAAGLVAREDRGRTAWLSRGLTSEEEPVLLKALLAWAGGDTYQIVSGEVLEPISFSLHKAIYQDMFQPVEVILKLGYVF